MAKKFSYDEVKEYVESLGLKLLGDYVNSKKNLKLECICERTFYKSLGNLKSKKKSHLCTNCVYDGYRKDRAKNIKEIIDALDQEDFKLLSTSYVNAHQEIEMECPKGHLFKRSWNSFDKGGRCPKCSKRLRRTYEEVVSYIEDQNYRLISNEFTGIHDYLDLECPSNHKFSMTFGHFYHDGNKCPKCIGKNKSLDEVCNYLNKEGYKVLDDEYINAYTKMKLKCPNNHIFRMSWTCYDRSHRCPVCYIENNKGENHYNWRGGISSLSNYLRDKITIWKQESLKKSNYQCELTNEKVEVIHHLYSFHNIVKETLRILNLPLYDSVNKYNNNELRIITDKCIELHQQYGLGVCLTKQIHNLFHKEYGNENNTPEQFENFKTRYNNGEFNNFLNT
jgi:hypothetical protein